MPAPRKRKPWEGVARVKSPWVQRLEEARETGKKYIIIKDKSKAAITKLLISNIAVYPDFKYPNNKQTLDSLLEWAEAPRNKNRCFRWDGEYHKPTGRPIFAQLQIMEVTPEWVPDGIYVERFLFEYAFGPWPSRKPLHPLPNCIANGIGMPKGIRDAAYCVNPYHKVFTQDDDPRTHRRWTDEQLATVTKYRKYHTSLRENSEYQARKRLRDAQAQTSKP